MIYVNPTSLPAPWGLALYLYVTNKQIVAAPMIQVAVKAAQNRY
jgi:hypothetical protein